MATVNIFAAAPLPSAVGVVTVATDTHAQISGGGVVQNYYGFGITYGFHTVLSGTDRLIYNTTTGALYYDADGTGGTNAVLVATLQGMPTLVAQDIAVI
jgi:Ca2+-binding RTX toxin-like protein